MTRQTYIDIDPGDPGDLSNWDVVEIKHDGLWGLGTVRGGQITITSRTGAVKRTAPAGGLPDCVLVGEYLHGTERAKTSNRTGRYYLFDVLEFDGRDIRDQAGATRREATVGYLFTAGKPPEWMRLCKQYPARDWRQLWTDCVETGQEEGLVFKNSRAPYNEPVGRMKARVTADYVCMGFKAGNGRNAESVGSIRAGLYIDGELRHVCDVGTGLSDRLRSDMAARPESYVGRVFEAVGCGWHKSGALRHAAFVRFRSDMRSDECISIVAPVGGATRKEIDNDD